MRRICLVIVASLLALGTQSKQALDRPLVSDVGDLDQELEALIIDARLSSSGHSMSSSPQPLEPITPPKEDEITEEILSSRCDRKNLHTFMELAKQANDDFVTGWRAALNAEFREGILYIIKHGLYDNMDKSIFRAPNKNGKTIVDLLKECGKECTITTLKLNKWVTDVMINEAIVRAASSGLPPSQSRRQDTPRPEKARRHAITPRSCASPKSD